MALLTRPECNLGTSVPELALLFFHTLISFVLEAVRHVRVIRLFPNAFKLCFGGFPFLTCVCCAIYSSRAFNAVDL